MAKRHPRVLKGELYIGSEAGEPTIQIGSAAWYSWLEQHSSFRFEAQQVSFIARKERRYSGWYWYAQRRLAGKQQTAYLGKSDELNLQRLDEIASAWQPTEEHDVSPAFTGAVANELLESTDERITDHRVGPSADLAFATAARAHSEKVDHRVALAPPPPLPAQLTSFVGRAPDVAALGALLRRDDVRLVTVVGAGGIGKTRLALQVAEDLRLEFPEGVYFIPLAPIRAPQLVLSAIAQALSLHRDDTGTIADLLKAALQHAQILLVLDNLEQVIAAAGLLLDLAASCPRLKLLITSREILHVSGEMVFAIGPLPFPAAGNMLAGDLLYSFPAVDLFIQRARSIVPNLLLDEANVQAVAEICSQLEGLPLAIELAAARVRLLPPRALLLRLADRLNVLTVSGRDRPARQQTLRATFDWSHNLLSANEQCVFRRLAVFIGGCDLDAAEAICAPAVAADVLVLDILSSLLDKSLLQPDDSAGSPRLRMAETVREYALEALIANGELEAVQEAHAAYYLLCTEQAEPAAARERQYRSLSWLERDYENLSAALNFLLAHADRERAVRFAGTLRWFWYVRGRLSEGLEWIERALGDDPNSVATLGDRKALYAAGLFALHLEQGARAQSWLEESLQLCEKAGDTSGIAHAVNALTLFFLTRGDAGAVQEQVERALLVAQEAPGSWGSATAWSAKGTLALYLGDYAGAHSAYRRSAALYDEVGDLFLRDLTLILTADALAAQGGKAHGRAMIAELIEDLYSRGLAWPVGYMLCCYGRIALRRDDGARARFLIEQGLALFRRLRDPRGIAQACRVLAQVALFQQDYSTALAMALECLQNARVVAARSTIIGCLEELADMAVRRGKATWAAQLWGAADRQRATTDPQQRPIEPTDRAQAVATARQALGTEAFAEAWSAGRVMAPEYVLSTDSITGSLAGQRTPALPRPAGLTRRELEVLMLIADGLSNGEIAERLVISLSTVVSYLNLIYQKLNVSSRTAAMRYALDHQLC